MKKFCTLLLACGLLTVLAFGQGGIVPTVANPFDLNLNATAGPAGTLSTPSGLLLTVSAGPIFCGGDVSILDNTQFSLQASSSYIVGVSCPFGGAFVRPLCSNTLSSSLPGVQTPCVGSPTGPNEITLGTAVTNATVVSSTTDLRNAAFFPLVTDGTYIVPLYDCGISVGAGTFAAPVLTGAGNSGANPGIFRTAAGSMVLQAVTTAATSALNLTCDLSPPSKLTTNKGAVINNVQLFYGDQTTALTSITAPTIQSLTYPATGAAAGLTNAAAGGALTVTPGTLQLTTTTTGQCFSENIALAAPIAITTDLQRITLDQVFNQSAAAAETLQVCGVIVHYTEPNLY